jgi:Icc-related predicted phosphoesterase
MAKQRTRLYFVSDLHGSGKCFRKFLNGGPIYDADVMVLGGDLAGKAIQSITRASAGRFTFTFRGASYDLEDGDELRGIEQLIADHGYYPYRADPGELADRQAGGTLDELFLALITERLEQWLKLADERLRLKGIPLYWMLGNDDPPELAPLLDDAPWGTHCEGRDVLVGGHEMISWGYANTTPWHTFREMTDDELRAVYERLVSELSDARDAIFNFHPPPYDTGLDEAPVLDENLTVQTAAGQAKMSPVGSKAVREILERVQPLLGLHGHIHESAGFRKLGRTVAINPGSDYGSGVLNGVLVTLEPQKVKAYQFVRG